MAKSGIRRAVPWFVLAGIIAVVMMGSGIATVLVMMHRIEDGRVELTVGGSVCEPVEEWPADAIVLVREGVPIAPRNLRPMITVTDGSGATLPLRVSEGTTISGPTGSFVSIAGVDLSAVAPGTDVCFEVASDPSLQAGDLVVYPDFIGSLIIGIFGTMCLLFVLFLCFGGAAARGIYLAVKA